MSSTNVVSLVSFKPNRSDPVTKKRQVQALELLKGAPGCRGVIFEGIAREEPDVSVRCVEWNSVKAHAAFESSATQYTRAIQTSTTETLYSRHYNLFNPLRQALAAGPECIEYVVFTLKDGVAFDEFNPHWRHALKEVEESPGCCPVVLGQDAENPSGIVQIQGWMTLEDHIEGFKNREDLPSIMGPLTEVVSKYVEGGWKGFKSYHLLLTAPGEAV